MNLECEYLIIGSGIAALRAAIELSDTGQIVILTKAGAAEGSTGYAQGGIAAALGPDDSPEQHAIDTITAGAGLCREDAVRLLTTEGPRYVRELVEWGAGFDRGDDGTLALAREGAHAVRRVLHARDATGREIGRTLWRRASAHSRIRVVEHAQAVEVLVVDGQCRGVRFLIGDSGMAVATASATLLATGGAGQVYRETTNPSVATGDGVAMAYHAGARVADMEFVQFHPTALAVGDGRRFLLSEALRGEGARLINEEGEPFMQRMDPDGDLAPRDRVARGMVREMERTGGPVYLTLDGLPPDFVRQRFPMITEACRRVGLDLARDRIPVSPAAHYIMGGVEVDLEGHSSVPGLFAAGEVASTGVHGANRLASNSLLEGLVFGATAGRAMRRWAQTTQRYDSAPPVRAAPRSLPDAPVERDVRELMWQRVGLFRDGAGLSEALGDLDEWAETLDRVPRDSDAARLNSLVTVGRLIARAAVRRRESRGAHYRTDFPERNDIDWTRHISDSKGTGGSDS